MSKVKTFITISRHKIKKQINIDNITWKWIIKLKIDIKNQTYYFFNDIINIDFDPYNIKIVRKSYILDMWQSKNTQNEYPFRYLNGYFDEINGNIYLTLVPTNESKLGLLPEI